MMTTMLDVQHLGKSFVLHQQGGAELNVLDGVSFKVRKGECLALQGPSGSGKSTLMRLLYANYKAQRGHIWIHDTNDINIDLVTASPRQILNLRRNTVGYVSQFLRVIPRVSCLQVVMEPLRQRGVGQKKAQVAATNLLNRLHIPEALWSLAPSTFSGGEQQRVNIARGFIATYPLLLLDEPTASLDVENRNTVIDLMLETKAAGTALIGIFHDQEVREAVADQVLEFS